MDVARMKNDVKLVLCRKYYYAGFAFLPFLWAINSIWFFKTAFLDAHYEEQTTIKKYVIRSAAGAILWTGLFLAWTIVFQLNRASWGELGDQLSFVIPKGKP